MTTRSRWFPCCAAVLLLSCSSLVAATADEAVAVFFVRHAEKDTDDPRDPQLSDSGRLRADALSRLLAKAGVSHLFSSQFKRTRETLAPLAKLAGVEIAVVRAQEPATQLAALRDLPAGAVAVVAGHSNTIPQLVCDLGGRPRDLDCSESDRTLGEGEYDRLYLVVLPSPACDDRVPLQTLSLRYGD